MDCKKCLQSGNRREGGPLGLCWKHQRSKCEICGRFSAGENLCAECAHSSDLQRWAAESNLRIIQPDEDDFRLALRKEKLLQAKFHAHRAVEVFFRSLVLSSEAIWGDIESGDNELKKSA